MLIAAMLHKDRSIPGVLIVDLCDQCKEIPIVGMPCLGQSDKLAATKHGNPDRDPLKPYGNTPTGIYNGTVTVAGANTRSYGPNKRILLTPVSGDALLAKTRWGLMIHGGDTKPNGDLRVTHGCIRVSNESMEVLIDLAESNAPITVSVIELV